MPPGAPALFADSLSSQEIAGDTLAERAVREDCVRILTAHRSKGLEWDVVVVAGVQEATWPDLRMRGSLLGVDELAEAASGPGQDASADVDAALLAAKLLAEERRLFYVAVTRAKKAAGRHRGRRRGHGPKTVPVPDRAGGRRHRRRAGRRHARRAPLAVHARAGRRLAPGRRRHRAPAGRPAGRSGPAGPAGRRRGFARRTRASGTR